MELQNGAHKAQKKETISLPTHNIMGVDLGRVDDLFYDDKSFELQKDLTSDILLSLDNFRINIPFQKNEGNSPDIIIEFKVQSELDFPLKDIHYLDAERLGPRYICEYKGLNKDSCGIHGENTAYVWFTHESDRIDNKKWKKYLFEDEEYLIVAPKESDDLAKEGMELHHCVKSYIDAVSEGRTNILFLRKKEEPEKPFFTIEVTNDDKIRHIMGLK